MFCFLKRALPFTLTLIVGTGVGSLFNLFSASPQTAEVSAYRTQSSYTTSCRTRSRARFIAQPNATLTYSSARILSQVGPSYTAEARRNRTEGEVILRLTLSADGTVSDIETIKELPDGLTEQARKAARLTKFVPATRNGSQIDEMKTMTYTFNLD